VGLQIFCLANIGQNTINVQMKSLEGKNILVIGGGSGMGAATALLFCEHGAKVAIAGRKIDSLRETEGLSQEEQSLSCKTADVGNRQSLEELFAWFDKELGQLDILINAAGINIPQREMSQLSGEDWDNVLKTNLTGAFDSLRLALERMRPRRDGLIVMINSISGKRSNPLGGVAYNASKFGMTALGACVSEEEREHGVRITNLFPGEVNTPILDKRPTPPPAEHRAKILQPEDIAQAIILLAQLPPRAHVPELIIKPTIQSYL
jgi:NAD(P)-dependent dehydrogenase (short-subunit alcohol dehydrogenase family)